jgi:hypothetical protein
MECPKCNGEAYLVEEDFVKVIENTEPMKVVAKAVYQCRSCGERFSRLVIENIDAKKAQPSQPARPQGIYSGQTYGIPEPTKQNTDSPEGDVIDQLKFF